MTFLAGPRACIGYRFALMEIKVLVFTIFRDIAFELPSPAPKIENGPALITRPIIKETDGTSKNTMPLVLKLAQHE
ncbi:hypothetical protein M407DRAFT_16997 [Tulasnella calospora MUT 4182]|uniref:Cytochrome P450 n=1 Tax=Tulasnella calospora MUT 4182 TaxID=1051891 RepID=A0A0C3QY32_9AGAM|nr:hypothetical protein M407DRAFT_16997 [Tulasnella calospora MUT 4182]